MGESNELVIIPETPVGAGRPFALVLEANGYRCDLVEPDTVLANPRRLNGKALVILGIRVLVRHTTLSEIDVTRRIVSHVGVPRVAIFSTFCEQYSAELDRLGIPVVARRSPLEIKGAGEWLAFVRSRIDAIRA